MRQASILTFVLTDGLTETSGYATIAGRQLILTEAGERTETALESDYEVLAAYERWCGVTLDRVPVLEDRT